MSFVLSTISGKKLLDYSVSSKFCSFKNTSCVIGSKYGKVSFDFSKFHDANECHIKFKRRSGNGLISITSLETSSYNVSSKIGESVRIKLAENKKLDIIRPFSGIGDVEVLQVSLMAKEIDAENINIKDELRKCKTKFIRVVEDRVFANEGSIIDAGEDDLVYVETLPHEIFEQEGSVVKFKGLCELKKLKVLSKKVQEAPEYLSKINEASKRHDLIKPAPIISKNKNHNVNGATSFISGVYDISIDSFRYDIMNFSRVYAEKFDDVFDSEIEINLKPVTNSMNKWVAKFANLFPKVTVDSELIFDCSKKSSDDSVLLTDIRNLFPHKKIMLEEFFSDLNQEQISILQSADVIFSTSLVNCQYLRSLSGINRVLYVPKFWPYKEPIEPIYKEPYNLLFSRSIKNTVHFCSAYNLKKKLVVVGYRGSDIGFDFFSENIPYNQLLSLIYNSDCVIDFPSNMHYFSGLLDFAHIANKPIITTNHWLSVSKPKANVVSTLFNSGDIVPDIKECMRVLKNIKPYEVNTDMYSYNYNLKSSLMIMKEG